MSKRIDLVNNLYPTTKFIGVIVIILSAFIVPGWKYSYSIFFVCALIALISGKLKGYLLITVNSLGILIFFMFLIQAVLIPSGEILYKIGFINVYKDGFYQALNFSSKLVAFTSAFILFFRVTTVKDFILSLENMGLHPKVTYVIMSTLQMIPEMKKEAGVISDAQKTRGVETEGNIFVRAKAFVPVLIPLVLSSIAKTEERAITLESRAFSSGAKKTRLYNIKKTKNDTIAIIILVVFLILCIGWRVLTIWHF
ncbi:MAG: energy-coupling factor transporter transmembrane component T [Leptotrichiaceae bacterium]